MNLLTSISNPIKYNSEPSLSALPLPTPVIYYTCITADIDTVNKKIKNYVTNSYDITYNTTGFISTDTNFSNSTGWGCFNANNTNFGLGTSQYAFTDSSRAVTICYWLKITSLTPKGYYAVDIGRGPFNQSILVEMDFNTTTGYMQNIFVYCGIAAISFNKYPANFDVRNWFHISVIVENNKTPKLYINGSLITGTNPNIYTLNTFTTPNGISISGLPSGQTNRVSCKINELRVYNKALSNAQISSIYNWDGTGTL